MDKSLTRLCPNSCPGSYWKIKHAQEIQHLPRKLYKPSFWGRVHEKPDTPDMASNQQDTVGEGGLLLFIPRGGLNRDGVVLAQTQGHQGHDGEKGQQAGRRPFDC